MFVLRAEAPVDQAAIREVNRLAFGSDTEPDLIDRLRHDGLVVASLVAVDQGRVVGHILFSELAIEPGNVIRAVSLAPLAVAPARQRAGIGSALVEEGLAVCRQRGVSVAVVLGHPAYYSRFGFSSNLAERLRGPYSGDAWMAVELTPGALRNFEGAVRYPAAFDVVNH